MALQGAIQRAVASADGAQTASDIQLLESLVSDSLAGRRLIVDMLAAFAGLALVLAVVGIYGLISFVTNQRTNEVGVRMALGAQRLDVIWLVLTGALNWLADRHWHRGGAVLMTNMLLRQSFAGFGSGILSSLALAVVSLLVVGIFAAFLPARRAALSSLFQALRSRAELSSGHRNEPGKT